MTDDPRIAEFEMALSARVAFNSVEHREREAAARGILNEALKHSGLRLKHPFIGGGLLGLGAGFGLALILVGR